MRQIAPHGYLRRAVSDRGVQWADALQCSFRWENVTVRATGKLLSSIPIWKSGNWQRIFAYFQGFILFGGMNALLSLNIQQARSGGSRDSEAIGGRIGQRIRQKNIFIIITSEGRGVGASRGSWGARIGRGCEWRAALAKGQHCTLRRNLWYCKFHQPPKPMLDDN